MPSKRAIWMAGLKRLLDTATAAVDDTLGDRGSDLVGQVREFLDGVEGKKDRVDFDEWPETWRRDIEAAIKRVETWMDGGFLAQAVALASTVEDALVARGARLERMAEAFDKVDGRLEGARDKLDELDIGERSDSWVDLDRRYASAAADLRAAHEAWERGGDAETAESLLDRLSGEITEVYIAAKMLPFEGAKTLHLMQGTFKVEGSDAPLLQQLDSEGVCQALALDWLAGGGSKSEPGTVVDGTITSRHLTWQAQNELEGNLLKSMGRIVSGQSSAPSPKKEAGEYLAAARSILDELLDQQRGIGDEVDRLQSEVDDLARELASQRESDLELGVEPSDPDDDPVLSRLKGQLDQAKVDERSLPDKILQQRLLVAQLDALNTGGPPPVGVDPVDFSIDVVRDKLARIMRARDEERRRRRRLWGKGGPDLPMATFRALGVMPDDGDAGVTEPDGDGGALTARQVEGALRDLIDGVTAGETWSYEIGLNIPDGHATAARITQAGRGTELDIELFDPNIGAYRFDDSDRAVACFRSWFEDVYGGSWVRVETKKIRVLAKESDDIRTRDGLGVGGLSLSATFAQDRVAVVEMCGRADDLPGMPGPAKEAVARALARADRLAKGMTESVDLRVAQGALQQAYDLAQSSIELHTRCVVLDDQLRRGLKPDDREHAAALRLYEAAGKAHRAGDLLAAEEGFRKAKSTLDLVVATQRLVHDVDVTL